MCGILGVCGASRRHHRSPASAPAPAGQDPGEALPQDDHITAPFAAECQSFLRLFLMLFFVHRIRKCRPLQTLFLTVWLEVRVLPAPPCSPTLTEISRGLTSTRGFAGRRAGLQSLQGRRTASEAVRGLLSLAIQKPFPRSVGRSGQRLGSHATETGLRSTVARRDFTRRTGCYAE